MDICLTPYEARVIGCLLEKERTTPEQERGIVCVLLLRGPQTAGELRTRCERLCKFQAIHDVESTLDQLIT